jgi:hypothetical protein
MSVLYGKSLVPCWRCCCAPVLCLAQRHRGYDTHISATFLGLRRMENVCCTFVVSTRSIDPGKCTVDAFGSSDGCVRGGDPETTVTAASSHTTLLVIVPWRHVVRPPIPRRARRLQVTGSATVWSITMFVSIVVSIAAGSLTEGTNRTAAAALRL